MEEESLYVLGEFLSLPEVGGGCVVVVVVVVVSGSHVSQLRVQLALIHIEHLEHQPSSAQPEHLSSESVHSIGG